MSPMLLADAHPVARSTKLSPRAIADSRIGDSTAAIWKSLPLSEHFIILVVYSRESLRPI